MKPDVGACNKNLSICLQHSGVPAAFPKGGAVSCLSALSVCRLRALGQPHPGLWSGPCCRDSPVEKVGQESEADASPYYPEVLASAKVWVGDLPILPPPHVTTQEEEGGNLSPPQWNLPTTLDLGLGTLK